MRHATLLLAALATVAGATLAGATLSCARPRPAAAPRYDIVIAGGRVVDGTGAPAFRADVAVRGGRIAAVSREPIPRAEAARVIDAAGAVVTPGFIDLHAHLEPLLRLPGAESAVRQGVTTALGGPDGSAPWPLAPYLDSAAAAGLGINVAFLAGHNTIRRAVMGEANRAPTPDELERMRGMVARAMGDGAFGLSTGLRYVPGAFSGIDEVVALARVAADSGGIYTSHLRAEGLGVVEGVAEAMEIGRRARIPVVLTHHKVIGQRMWGASARTLAMVDSARAAGTDVMMDQYPYTASYTGIGVLLPEWALADGDSALARRVRDPVLRDSIVRGIVFNILNDRGGGELARVQLARVPWSPELEGKTLADWARMRGLASTPESAAELVLEAMARGGANAIYHAMADEDVERIMRHPQTMIASDGRLTTPGDGHPHPRWYGTFPRVLGRYVRERRLLSLEEAVRKMTGMPAARLALPDRGRVAPGMMADLVVLDPATVADRATFERPHQYPAGIDWVLVNGVVTVEAGRYTGARGGRVVRRRAREM
jgi:dihydroorotase/N-acyl-D-amino-acid deacylase